MGKSVEGMERVLAEHEKTLKATRKVIQGIEKQLRLHTGVKDVEIRKDLTAWKKRLETDVIEVIENCDRHYRGLA